MAYFKRDRFNGIAPGVAPRLLSEQFGQIAQDVDLESGRLVASKQNSDQYNLSTATKKSIYLYNAGGVDRWLEWAESGVKAVKGPIPGDTTDRLYFTGAYVSPGNYPRVGNAVSLISGTSYYPVNSYRLGVPAPQDTPTTTVTGAADDTAIPNEVSYVYTFVTSFGEEGPPSPAAAVISLTDTETVEVSTPSDSSGASGLNFGTGALKRLYRSNTGSTNTTFQFVGEALYSAPSITDNKEAANLGEVLPSGDWIGPPNEDTSLYPDGPLQGLIPLAQGVMAGFTGKRFCLSEPFLPHAWPISYRITTEEDIVAIASTANGVVALTDGQPYFITGTDPSAMTAIRVDLAQACVNTDSVVDMGDYLLYAGPDGLCVVQSSSGEVITKGLISVQQWNSNFYPTLIKAFKHEGTYVAFWTSGSNHGGWIFDPRGNENALTTFDVVSEVRGGYSNPKTGELYIIQGSKIKKFRDANQPSNILTFKSKKFVTPNPVSMGWVSVNANEYPIYIKVWGDGNLLLDLTIGFNTVTKLYSALGTFYTQGSSPGDFVSHTITSSLPTVLHEPIVRMPPVIAQEWEIQVRGKDINEFCLAQSMDEIRGL